MVNELKAWRQRAPHVFRRDGCSLVQENIYVRLNVVPRPLRQEWLIVVKPRALKWLSRPGQTECVVPVHSDNLPVSSKEPSISTRRTIQGIHPCLPTRD